MARRNLCYIILFILTFVADTFDFVSDWVFYNTLTVAEDGLVFGVFDDTVVKVTLTFCIIGTVTYVLELALSITDCFCETDDISEVMNIITLLIEDLPQIAINVQIASCREEATTYVQIMKASAAILEIVITFTVMAVKFSIQKRNQYINKRRVLYMVARVLLLLTILALSSVVLYFVFNFNTDKVDYNREGLGGEVADRYLNGVAVYARINTPNLPKMTDNQWMKLVDIRNLTHLANPAAGLLLSVVTTSTPLQYMWVRKHSDVQSPSTFQSLGCYKADSSGMAALAYKHCSSVFSNNDDTDAIVLHFTYVPPNSAQPIGDIHYNTKVHGCNCGQVPYDIQVNLKYFKVKPDVNDALTLVSNGQNGGQFRYYSLPGDITDVRQAWKTGKLRCDSTGRESPKLSPSIEVPCVA